MRVERIFFWIACNAKVGLDVLRIDKMGVKIEKITYNMLLQY